MLKHHGLNKTTKLDFKEKLLPITSNSQEICELYYSIKRSFFLKKSFFHKLAQALSLSDLDCLGVLNADLLNDEEGREEALRNYSSILREKNISYTTATMKAPFIVKGFLGKPVTSETLQLYVVELTRENLPFFLERFCLAAGLVTTLVWHKNAVNRGDAKQELVGLLEIIETPDFTKKLFSGSIELVMQWCIDGDSFAFYSPDSNLINFVKGKIDREFADDSLNT